jgi:hypothetical protein
MTTITLLAGVHSIRAVHGGGPASSLHQVRSRVPGVSQASHPAAESGFAAAVNYPAGTTPRSVAVGDFNGDGNPDLVVANSESDNLSVLLGIGDGTFQAARNYFVPTGSSPVSVAVGDFNGDGKADLAVANIGGQTGTVSVLLGNGDGTFQPAATYATDSTSLSLAIGDFNGDAKLDLVVANQLHDDVSVLLGNGDGTFQPAVNYPAGVSSVSVAIGDFNGDGKADLAVANAGSGLGVLLGNGNGSFQAPVMYLTGINQSPVAVAVGDFNGDRKQDLVLVNQENDVSVLLGNGDGTFQRAANYAVGSNPRSVAVADFNADGNTDLVVANVLSNTLSVLLGNGNGTFQAAVGYAVGSSPNFVAVGDFNGDGKADLAVSNGGGNSVSVLLGSNTGAPFHPPFFSGEVSLGSGVYYLQFPDGDLFGYYNYQSFPILYHYDLGFEYFIEANDAGTGAYLYDFAGGHWFYTRPSLFPYLYDFTLNDWLYYFQSTGNPGHYTTNPRYFSNLRTGKIFTM